MKGDKSGEVGTASLEQAGRELDVDERNEKFSSNIVAVEERCE